MARVECPLSWLVANCCILELTTSDRMHSMIQTEGTPFIIFAQLPVILTGTSDFPPPTYWRGVGGLSPPSTSASYWS